MLRPLQPFCRYDHRALVPGSPRGAQNEGVTYTARGLKEGFTPAGLAVASRHHPGESGRRGSCVGGQGSGGGVWGDSGVRLHLLTKQETRCRLHRLSCTARGGLGRHNR